MFKNCVVGIALGKVCVGPLAIVVMVFAIAAAVLVIIAMVIILKLRVKTKSEDKRRRQAIGRWNKIIDTTLANKKK